MQDPFQVHSLIPRSNNEDINAYYTHPMLVTTHRRRCGNPYTRGTLQIYELPRAFLPHTPSPRPGEFKHAFPSTLAVRIKILYTSAIHCYYDFHYPWQSEPNSLSLIYIYTMYTHTMHYSPTSPSPYSEALELLSISTKPHLHNALAHLPHRLRPPNHETTTQIINHKRS